MIEICKDIYYELEGRAALRTCIASELNKTVNGIISLLGIMYLNVFDIF